MLKADECLERLAEIDAKLDEVAASAVTPEEIWLWLFGVPAVSIISVLAFLTWG